MPADDALLLRALADDDAAAVEDLPRVVVVGAGFGGLSAVKGLAGAPVQVLLIDRRNHHLFQPLLYQVATAALSPCQIATPIRSAVRGQANVRVALGEVTGIDVARRQVLFDGGEVAYDRLILATGATHNYFGRDEWAAHATSLKSLEDALSLRRRVLLAFERAELALDDDLRRKLLTFVVIGGGPTGVEMAGAIAELARKTLSADFHAIRGQKARIVLVEAGPALLPSFPAKASAYVRRALEALGVEVRTGVPITHCGAAGVRLAQEAIEASTIVWAAGVRASAAAGWIGAACDRSGRAVVDGRLSPPGHPEILVIGDVAHVADLDGQPLPGVAPVAKQQGEYAARRIASELGAARDPGAFRYRAFGLLATVGREAAAAVIGPVRLTGALAWLFWCVVHIYFLIGFRNRLAVSLEWMWAYVTFDRGARLITSGWSETEGRRRAPRRAPV